jgi:hypothetical protein
MKIPMMKHSHVLFILALLLLGIHASWSQVPQLVNLQGRIVVDGTNFDGNGLFKFALVRAGGTATYWSNDGSSVNGSEPGTAVMLPVSNGHYSLLLGDTTHPNMTALPATVFDNGGVWLRTWFDDGNGSELLTPDRRLASVAYTFLAANVEDGAITSAKLGSGAVTSDKIFANAVNSSKLAQDSVGSSEIETDAVGASEIAANAVGTGEVELHAGRAPVQSLKTGEAVTIENGGQQQNPVAADPNAFAKLDTFEPQSLREQRARFDRWQAHSRQLRQDPRLIVYYPCDQNGSWQRSLINETGDPERRGAMVGVKRTPGRWPWKGAVEFRRPGDRVRVFIPGEYTSLTLLCWVRLDSVDRMWNSLYLTDGYEKGEVHWQITEEGRLAYSMRVRETGEHRQYLYLSPPFWKSELSGRWIHLATTFDAGKAEVIHYLDGAEIHREKSTPEHVVKTTRFGAGEIGNWGLSLKRTDPEFVIRSLNGLMDEFAIFSGALSGPEIKSMFEAGNPVGR